MTKEIWKEFLGNTKFNELRRIADNQLAMEALEDVICQEIKADNLNQPGRPADLQGNFFYAYIDRLGPGLKNEELGEKLRSYHFALLALNRAFRELKSFKSEPEQAIEPENDAV